MLILTHTVLRGKTFSVAFTSSGVIPWPIKDIYLNLEKWQKLNSHVLEMVDSFTLTFFNTEPKCLTMKFLVNIKFDNSGGPAVKVQGRGWFRDQSGRDSWCREWSRGAAPSLYKGYTARRTCGREWKTKRRGRTARGRWHTNGFSFIL